MVITGRSEHHSAEAAVILRLTGHRSDRNGQLTLEAGRAPAAGRPASFRVRTGSRLRCRAPTPPFRFSTGRNPVASRYSRTTTSNALATGKADPSGTIHSATSQPLQSTPGSSPPNRGQRPPVRAAEPVCRSRSRSEAESRVQCRPARPRWLAGAAENCRWSAHGPSLDE